MTDWNWDTLTREQLMAMAQDQSRRLSELHRDIIRAKQAALTALDTAYWMSAASDFSPEGKAHEGWKKAKVDLAACEARLEEVELGVNRKTWDMNPRMRHLHDYGK